MSHAVVVLAVLAAVLGTLWWWMNRPFGEQLVTGEPAEIEAAATSPALQGSSPNTAAAPWEAKIDTVLEGNLDEPATARRLIELLPSLPAGGQVAAAHHICDLLDDKEYGIALPVLLDAKLPEDVLKVLFTDTMNRRDSVKLRAWIEVANVPDHPFREEALDDLEIYTEHDYASDFQGWTAAVEKYLRDNPEEAGKP